MKRAYSTRFVASRMAFRPSGWSIISGSDVTPRAGDVVVARVDKLGQHPRLEAPEGRPAALFPGDEIVVAYANRYAPDQFEALVPADLGPAQLIAAGGLAGRVVSAHSKMSAPTQITPLGLLAERDRVMNLIDFAPGRINRPVTIDRAECEPTVIIACGTSMNSGKTSAAAAIVRGLRAGGLRVNAGKATGTAAGGDPHLLRDSGSKQVLDFTNFGYGATYLLDHDKVLELFHALLAALQVGSPDAVVIEVADGIFERETSVLLKESSLRAAVDHVVFCAAEAAGAEIGFKWLDAAGLRPRAVSGVLTASPLATREAAGILPVPVLPLSELERPDVAMTFMSEAVLTEQLPQRELA